MHNRVLDAKCNPVMESASEHSTPARPAQIKAPSSLPQQDKKVSWCRWSNTLWRIQWFRLGPCFSRCFQWQADRGARGGGVMRTWSEGGVGGKGCKREQAGGRRGKRKGKLKGEERVWDKTRVGAAGGRVDMAVRAGQRDGGNRDKWCGGGVLRKYWIKRGGSRCLWEQHCRSQSGGENMWNESFGTFTRTEKPYAQWIHRFRTMVWLKREHDLEWPEKIPQMKLL